MTCDERLEALLNRAGQTISDLPKDYLDTSCILAFAGVQEWQSENKLSTQHICEKYILHLTDIIDRMETALENVCGERDWLKEMARFDECPTCSKHIKGDVMVCGIEGDWLQDEFGNWNRRADDE